MLKSLETAVSVTLRITNALTFADLLNARCLGKNSRSASSSLSPLRPGFRLRCAYFVRILPFESARKRLPVLLEVFGEQVLAHRLHVLAHNSRRFSCPET